jgi:hypothetical protein
MCSGVVPQQPPTRFSSPLSANSPRAAAMCSGVSSYSPKAFGRPGVGVHADEGVRHPAELHHVGTQLLGAERAVQPTTSGSAWRSEYQNASQVCPDRVRPLASVMVPEIISGTR